MDVPERLRDLVTSPQRQMVFDLICRQERGFSFDELIQKINAENIQVSTNLVQQFISALVIRKFLTGTNRERNGKRGRSIVDYRLTNPIAQ